MPLVTALKNFTFNVMSSPPHNSLNLHHHPPCESNGNRFVDYSSEVTTQDEKKHMKRLMWQGRMSSDQAEWAVFQKHTGFWKE